MRPLNDAECARWQSADQVLRAAATRAARKAAGDLDRYDREMRAPEREYDKAMATIGAWRPVRLGA